MHSESSSSSTLLIGCAHRHSAGRGVTLALLWPRTSSASPSSALPRWPPGWWPHLLPERLPAGAPATTSGLLLCAVLNRCFSTPSHLERQSYSRWNPYCCTHHVNSRWNPYCCTTAPATLDAVPIKSMLLHHNHCAVQFGLEAFTSMVCCWHL